ncbi:transglycosylase domain-containing protein [Ferdinandcohnia quinoae]|uniref:PBP1A family penicillin-binding protein n=1 Tax=Fredinandcohnia quinoae TaxID=2918902 RepID=A0AAW5E5M6_9BACI|nr:PBP1A family penicillin-binding protein [Fredinandcohnia sp. SECRCQ15]MCH1626834.1 PBP1A family penicillin-binding protein [Fredinandcohnia sp. SECRCQ15]
MTFFVILGSFILGLIGYLLIIYAGNYVIDDKKLVMNSASRLVDQDGNLITKLYYENRDLVSIQDIPDYVQNAFIAIEDTRFYKHHGIDLQAISRALYKDILAGGKVEGGSTITQQLAKNVFLTNEKTFLRKTKELIIAINLEEKYSKKELLEMYLNQIYFGHGAYGIQSASKLYFNKNVNELTIEEGALLAAIPKAPTKYSPINNIEKSKERRDLVINLMEDKGYLKPEEAVRLVGKTVSLNVQEFVKEPALLTYIDMVFDEAKARYSLSNEELMRGGYTITVPLNVNLQKTAYEMFQDPNNFPGIDESAEGAFVLLDNDTGGVLASIGGRNYVRKGTNRVNIKRQPGSTLKPLAVYGPALEEHEFEPYSLLVDKKVSYGDYEPSNYHDTYKGKISMYDAVLESTNAPAVWILDKLGIPTVKNYLKKTGISIPDQGLSIALGGLKEGISPIDMAKAYRAFAREGNVIEPHIISKIVDRNNNVIGQASTNEINAFSKQTAWYMTRMLEGVVKKGTGKAGEYLGALAGKTGTTNMPNAEKGIKDAWFVGYTPSVVGAIWMGYDQTDDRHYLKTGSAAPTRLFKEILEKSNIEKMMSFTSPKGVRELEPPIRLVEITDLTADLSFKPLGLFTVTLNWTPGSDERIEYRIYEEQPKGLKYIASVIGKGRFEIENINVFSIPSYCVIPYNSQTEQEGIESSLVKPTFFSNR